MFVHRSPIVANAARFMAVFVAVVLTVTACGSSDDGDREVVSQAEETLTAEPTDPVTVEPTTQPAPESFPIEVPDLVGKDLYVQVVESASSDLLPPSGGAVARIRFNEDGTVTGNAACNDFTANYEVDGADLSITNFEIGGRGCVIPDWSAFVEFLPKVTGYGSAGGPDPILFAGSDASISLGATPPA